MSFTDRMLTCTGEKRIQPNEVIVGGILTVTKLSTARQGPWVHYVKHDRRTGYKIGSGRMRLTEWAKLNRSHKNIKLEPAPMTDLERYANRKDFS